MIHTLPLEELEKMGGNIYKAIVMVAKRADQINSAQKKILDAETEAVEDDPLMEEQEMTEMIERQYLKFPKPTAIAMQELLEGKLLSPEDEQATDE